ncbi:unnamed protein product, partial [Ectocarpus fasciculatus]
RDHLSLAHTFLDQILRPGDTVIDATAGNGHDSSFIAERILDVNQGSLLCMDVQDTALCKTRATLLKTLTRDHGSANADTIIKDRIQLLLQNHSEFPNYLEKESVAAIVYNLGYLPGSDKTITTNPSDTIQSIESATALLKVGGMISVLAYRGHDGGLEETAAVEQYVSSLRSFTWSVYSHVPMNRPISPVLYSLYKNASLLP